MKETRLRVEASEVQVCEMEERQGEGDRGVRPGNGERRRRLQSNAAVSGGGSGRAVASRLTVGGWAVGDLAELLRKVGCDTADAWAGDCAGPSPESLP